MYQNLSTCRSSTIGHGQHDAVRQLASSSPAHSGCRTRAIVVWTLVLPLSTLIDLLHMAVASAGLNLVNFNPQQCFRSTSRCVRSPCCCAACIQAVASAIVCLAACWKLSSRCVAVLNSALDRFRSPLARSNACFSACTSRCARATCCCEASFSSRCSASWASNARRSRAARRTSSRARSSLSCAPWSSDTRSSIVAFAALWMVVILVCSSSDNAAFS